MNSQTLWFKKKILHHAHNSHIALVLEKYVALWSNDTWCESTLCSSTTSEHHQYHNPTHFKYIRIYNIYDHVSHFRMLWSELVEGKTGRRHFKHNPFPCSALQKQLNNFAIFPREVRIYQSKTTGRGQCLVYSVPQSPPLVVFTFSARSPSRRWPYSVDMDGKPVYRRGNLSND